MRRLVAALACRNQGSRLYGKPLQNLDIDEGITILDNIVDCLLSIDVIDAVVLGAADGCENDCYSEYANSKKINCIRGDEIDVLGRLIKCGEQVGATDIFRSTSESPFPLYSSIDSAWQQHLQERNDATFLDDIVDGCGFEILTLDALQKSHMNGEDKHRSELCTLYIRENKEKFRIGSLSPDARYVRKDIRLTVDYPEDLIVCRAVYKKFKHLAPSIPLQDILTYLDGQPELLKLISPFCEEGYSTMYL